MIKGGKGGGSTVTGLNFEKGQDILSLLKKISGYSVSDDIIYFEGKEVARSYKKHNLYKYLTLRGVDYKKYISKRLLPDEAVYVIHNNTLFVIEMKFQEGSGSVDEKLQTCDFKNKQYQKLLAAFGVQTADRARGLGWRNPIEQRIDRLFIA